MTLEEMRTHDGAHEQGNGKDLQVADHLGGCWAEEELHDELEVVVHRIQRCWYQQQPAVRSITHKRSQ